MARALVQSFVGDVRLVVRSAGPVPNEEFDAHIVEAVERLRSVRVTLVVVRGEGGLESDAPHRAKLLQAGLLAGRFAIMADSQARRHETALRWLGAQMRLFPQDEFARACDFLDIHGPLRLEIARAIEALSADLTSGSAPGPGASGTMRVAADGASGTMRVAADGASGTMRVAENAASAVNERVARIKRRSGPSRP